MCTDQTGRARPPQVSRRCSSGACAIAIAAIVLLAAGCTPDRAAVNPGADPTFRGLLGRECLVVLRADAVGGQNVTDTPAPTDENDGDGNDNGNTPGAEVLPGVLYGTLTSISPQWVVLQGRGGNQFFIPRESVAVVSVVRK